MLKADKSKESKVKKTDALPVPPTPEELDMGVYFKYADLFKHLSFNTDFGWGWLPPSDEVFDAFRYVANEIRPNKMLEIGYYAGHSTSYWAELMPWCDITSCCPDHLRWLETHKSVHRAYGGRVEVMGVKSPEIITHLSSGHYDREEFPFVFIDGSHIAQDVFTDIHVALRLEAEWMLFDNATTRGVQMAIDWYKHHGVIEEVKRWHYTGLCKGKTAMNDLTLCKVIHKRLLDF